VLELKSIGFRADCVAAAMVDQPMHIPPGSEARRIGPFFYDPSKIQARAEQRLREVAPFYTDEIMMSLLVPVITQNFDVSLRALDWFAVNFTKKHKIVCKVNLGNGRSDVINIFSHYRDQLRHWRRRMFDPFRRRERIFFHHPVDGAILETTIGQLNFLMWSHNFGIIEQARAHLPAIEEDMVTTLAESKRRRQEERRVGAKRKRTELTRAPLTKCQVYAVRHGVDFEVTGAHATSMTTQEEEEEEGAAVAVVHSTTIINNRSDLDTCL